MRCSRSRAAATFSETSRTCLRSATASGTFGNVTDASSTAASASAIRPSARCVSASSSRDRTLSAWSENRAGRTSRAPAGRSDRRRWRVRRTVGPRRNRPAPPLRCPWRYSTSCWCFSAAMRAGRPARIPRERGSPSAGVSAAQPPAYVRDVAPHLVGALVARSRRPLQRGIDDCRQFGSMSGHLRLERGRALRGECDSGPRCRSRRGTPVPAPAPRT